MEYKSWENRLNYHQGWFSLAAYLEAEPFDAVHP